MLAYFLLKNVGLFPRHMDILSLQITFHFLLLYSCEMLVVVGAVHYKNGCWPLVVQEKPNYNWCRPNMVGCRVRLLLV